MDSQGLAGAARRLLRSSEAGMLATAAAEARAPFVLTHEGRPLLAAAALRAGVPARLRVAADGEPVSEVTVEGTLRAPRAGEGERFAAFFPGGAPLCLEPGSVRVVAAAGPASLAPGEFLLPEPGWKAEEQGILEHMNEDHEDSMLRMCRHYRGVEAAGARLVAVDAEGLHVRTERGTFYFAFDRRCETHDDVHHATVQLARTARLALAKAGAQP